MNDFQRFQMLRECAHGMCVLQQQRRARALTPEEEACYDILVQEAARLEVTSEEILYLTATYCAQKYPRQAREHRLMSYFPVPESFRRVVLGLE